MFRKLELFLSCAVFCSCNAFTANQLIYPGQDEFFELSIIHLNDFHARFEETSATSGTCHKDAKLECVGGLARVLTASRQLLEEQTNAIFLNAGDHYQGTLWHTVFHWNASVHFLNKLPQDVITIGNHDFDDSIEGLVPFLQRINVPVVVTNIDDSLEPTMQGLYKNSTIIERGNEQIGIIGVILQATYTLSRTGKLKFLDEVESVNAEAARLKAKGIDIIIVLSHVGINMDRIIAAKCPDIDIIVGGHSHTFLYTGPPPFIDRPADEYPVVIKQNKTDRTVLIVQAEAYTKYLGNLTVWFDSRGEVVDWQGDPILLDRAIPQDPQLIEELKPWKKVVDAIGLKKVGVTRSYLSSFCWYSPCNMANLVTDAMVHAYVNKTDNPKHWTYAAISCTNAGNLRTDISSGPITYGDLETVQPFGNTWDVVDLKGEDLYAALQESGSRIYSNGFLHWSGVRVTYNLTRPINSRVVDVKVRCQDCLKPKFEDLQREKWYRVVVIPFIIKKGDNLTTIAEKYRNRRVGNLDMPQLSDYVQSISPFDYKLDQRLVLLK